MMTREQVSTATRKQLESEIAAAGINYDVNVPLAELREDVLLLIAEGHECLYCGHECEDLCPPVDDDDAWDHLAMQHDDDCEWVRTRAHRHEGSEMQRYTDGFSTVEIQDGVYAVYTRGTADPLYRGLDADAARHALDLTAMEWQQLLMSDQDNS